MEIKVSADTVKGMLPIQVTVDEDDDQGLFNEITVRTWVDEVDSRSEIHLQAKRRAADMLRRAAEEMEREVG